MKNFKKVFGSIVLLWLFSTQLLLANDIENKQAAKPELKLRIVLFTPADKSFPENYMERYKDMVDYTEDFFVKWMNHWGYPCENPLKIERDENGYPDVLAIKGKLNYDDYKDLKQIRKEVVEQAEKQFDIPTEKQVWWILNYPMKKRSSRGGGNSQDGGTSFANYKDAEGSIKIGDDLAAGFMDQISFKSLIHELTHALGLGHIGPRDGDNLGNSLMGPVNKAYKQKYNNDSRVYLSEGEAALLWKHPLFSGDVEKRFHLPTVEVQNLKTNFDADNNQFVVEGKLKSDYPAHSAVILNASKGDKSPYWHKAFVGKINADGTFKCIVSELKEANGELVIVFGFNNGVISGDGKTLGMNKSGIRKTYSFVENKFVFQ